MAARVPSQQLDDLWSIREDEKALPQRTVRNHIVESPSFLACDRELGVNVETNTCDSPNPKFKADDRRTFNAVSSNITKLSTLPLSLPCYVKAK